MTTNRLGNKLLQTVLLILTLLAFVGCDAAAPAVEIFPAQQALQTAAAEWLVANHQNSDGGYADFSSGADVAPSGIGGTVDAILGLASADADTAAPVAYLESNPQLLEEYAAMDGGQAGKLILALQAAGQDPRNFAGIDFVTILQGLANNEGAYAPTAYGHALAMLGLKSVDAEIPAAAVEWLKSQQLEGGSWSDGFGTDDNVDATAMAMMALVAAGETAESEAVAAGKTFLKNSQSPTAGWDYSPAFGGQNPNSTALALQALSGIGEDIHTADSPWSQEGVSPLDTLKGFIGDNGAFQADFGEGPFDDFFSTAQAMIALTGEPYPAAVLGE